MGRGLIPVCVRTRTGRHQTRKKNGSNKFDPYTKNYTLFEKVLNFELWFCVFRFKFLICNVETMYRIYLIQHGTLCCYAPLQLTENLYLKLKTNDYSLTTNLEGGIL
jgi:hypothetical protein